MSIILEPGGDDKAVPTPELHDRPASTFRYTRDAHGCWLWDGYCDPNGYARIYDRATRKVVWAHRYSYSQSNGPLVAGMEIDHTCQVTRCVNPEHLEQVTRDEHVRRTMDRLGKNDLHRAAAVLRMQHLTYSEIAAALNYGSATAAHCAVQAAIEKGLVSGDDVPPRRTLTDAERADIRAMHAFGIPQAVIGEFYDTHSSQISRICNGATSGHTRRVA